MLLDIFRGNEGEGEGEAGRDFVTSVLVPLK